MLWCPRTLGIHRQQAQPGRSTTLRLAGGAVNNSAVIGSAVSQWQWYYMEEHWTVTVQWNAFITTSSDDELQYRLQPAESAEDSTFLPSRVNGTTVTKVFQPETHLVTRCDDPLQREGKLDSEEKRREEEGGGTTSTVLRHRGQRVPSVSVSHDDDGGHDEHGSPPISSRGEEEDTPHHNHKNGGVPGSSSKAALDGGMPGEEEKGGNERGGGEEVEEERSTEESFMARTPLLQAHHAMERMEEFVHKMWEGRWRVIPHDVLPDWLKDNDFLLHGHRPPMPSFRACFKSIFRIHTETGNIWTHLLGCLFFLCLGIVYMFRPNMSFVAPLQEKVAIGMFFLGAILCLSFSWLFHTVYCHSEGVSRVFSKLDYSGIAFLIMGSFVPWLYYSFYCNPQPCFIYLSVVCVLGVAAIFVSQLDFFATPQYRGVRAGVFVGLGLSGVVPTLHFMIVEGLLHAVTMGQMGWLLLMASLYITGAALYALRIPERFFPGKCDIWFHSHQLFHILVVAGAFVHFHGVSNLQEFRYTAGGCEAEDDGTL
ncbi:adiponectin receptor protein 2-like [Engraulis encrasicolus]|uniref:adiponectin receptor protein 2-like n=1 Tax=Engraulis encrasicolus TaxID=184585 RepID=UPI002FCEE726